MQQVRAKIELPHGLGVIHSTWMESSSRTITGLRINFAQGQIAELENVFWVKEEDGQIAHIGSKLLATSIMTLEYREIE